MAISTAETTSLIAFTLPGTAYSVRMSRFYVRAALGYHGLDEFTEDAQAVTSEFVTNAVAHAGAAQFSVEVVRLGDADAVAVIVTDSSPHPPVRRAPAPGSEQGRGLSIVDALSITWGWHPHEPGKAVYAVLTRAA